MKKLVLSFALVLAASMVSGQQLTKEQIKAQKKVQQYSAIKQRFSAENRLIP